MKKSVSLLLAGAMCAGLLAGCSSSSTSGGASAAASGSTAPSSVVSGEAGSKSIEKLSIAFVPSREPEEIITATEPLKEMLTAELAGLGYDVGAVEITVGTSYEAVGEALSAGTADVGLIPGGTYVLYDDGCDVLLTATRDGLSIDSDSAKDWNDNAPTEATTNQVTSYRALMIAGPSEKGQALAAKVNAGEDLTWEDVSGVNWSVMGSSSPAGYIPPFGCRSSSTKISPSCPTPYSPILTAAPSPAWHPARSTCCAPTLTPAATMPTNGPASMR